MADSLRSQRSKLTFGTLTCVLLLASSACIISIPGGTDRVSTVTPLPTLTNAGPANRLEHPISVQATQVAALAAEVHRLQEQVRTQATLLHYLATRGPARPPVGDRSITPTPYYPLTGSVEIEGGRCCAGGIAGETVRIEVAFEAMSPFAEITGMRVHAGGSPLAQAQFEQIAWQPYVRDISFEAPVFINWVGFYVQVQFRDELSNLSPIFVDDISVEGMPAPETPMP